MFTYNSIHVSEVGIKNMGLHSALAGGDIIV